MFENVTYNYYSNTMGRSVVPDETTFNNLAFEQKAYAKTLFPFVVEETETNGFDKAVNMFIEEQYKAELSKTADGRIQTSISLDGYSASFDTSKVQNVEDRKMFWLRAFCNVSFGVR